MMLVRRALLLFGGLVVLGVMAFQIAHKEQVLAEGTVVLLELRKVDPRSLMEGDYMRLRYEQADEAEQLGLPNDGVVHVRLDENRVATLASEGVPLRYRKRGDEVWLGTDAFYFEEGTAEFYNRARYAELRVDRTGESVLVGLCDEAYQRIGTP